MPERVGSHRDDVGDLAAQETLNRVAVYAEHMPGARGATLRELRERHAARPLAAVDAYRRVLAVLGPGVEAFEAWSASPDVAWSRWPTIEGDDLRRRVRVIAQDERSA